jgi:hypothetical protein
LTIEVALSAGNKRMGAKPDREAAGGAFVVEPHFRIGPSNFSVRIDHDGLWQRARPAPGGLPFLVLAPEDEFILLAFHGRKEEWARLKWIADLAMFLVRHPDLDWDLVWDRAQCQLLGRTVGLAALVLHRLTSREIPLAASVRRSPQLSRLANEVVSRWEDIRVPRSAFEVSPFQWALCDSAAARMSYLARTMATPRGIHFRMIKLPDWMFPAYYLIKVLHDYLLWPVWALARRLRAAVHREWRAAGHPWLLRVKRKIGADEPRRPNWLQ